MMTTPPAATIVLYDATHGGTPDAQGKLAYRDARATAATQSFADGATTLDTMANQADPAGYIADPRSIPPLDRERGYALHFRVQVVAEYHADSDKNGDGLGDRAGFSVITLSSDTRGIELGFWQDQIWAQEDGAAEPPNGTLFTRAESAPFDTATHLTDYTLTIRGDDYELSSAGVAILHGRLRDYTTFEGPVNPYRPPN